MKSWTHSFLTNKIFRLFPEKSRKRGYGPPAFVCLECNIQFMQKEDIFLILPLWDFDFNTTILQYSSSTGPACKLSKVWDILDWVKLPESGAIIVYLLCDILYKLIIIYNRAFKSILSFGMANYFWSSFPVCMCQLEWPIISNPSSWSIFVTLM